MKVDRSGGMKLIFVLFRRSDLSHDESLDQWSTEQHTSSHAIAPPSDAASDGLGDLWFDSPAAIEQAMNSPQMAAAVEDAKSFLDMERTCALAVDEKIILNVRPDVEVLSLADHNAFPAVSTCSKEETCLSGKSCFLGRLFCPSPVFQDGARERQRHLHRFPFPAGMYFPRSAFLTFSLLASGHSLTA
jgi:hypothetical protein